MLEPNRKVRVLLSRNGNELATDEKDVDEETGIANIKQSFNQKMNENFDNESQKWLPDFIELTLLYGDDVVGSVSFDLTRYID